jgi:pyruvate,water dikinase
MELIISNEIRVHPIALLRWPRLDSREAVEEIATLTRGYDDKAALFRPNRLRGEVLSAGCDRPPGDRA